MIIHMVASFKAIFNSDQANVLGSWANEMYPFYIALREFKVAVKVRVKQNCSKKVHRIHFWAMNL